MFCKRSDLNSGKKIGSLDIFLGGGAGGCSGTKFQFRDQLRILSTKFAITLSVCLCITDSLSHTTYVETKNT